MHLLPTDELRRQYEAGEITREYYEAMRKTEPDWRDEVCQTPRCTRLAFVVLDGVALCSVCALARRAKRRLGNG
jgi:hypothetical protein